MTEEQGRGALSEQEFEIVMPTPAVVKVAGKRFAIPSLAIGPRKRLVPIFEQADKASKAGDETAMLAAVQALFQTALREVGPQGELTEIDFAWIEENLPPEALGELVTRIAEKMRGASGEAPTPPAPGPASGGARHSTFSRTPTAGRAKKSSKT